MLKRRRKLSKDLQIRKKLLPLQKISGISAKQSSELVVLLSICIFFAEDKRHLGIIAQASLASSALDLHYLCTVYKKIGSAHRDSDTRVRQNFLWRAVSPRRFATQCVTINNS